MSFDFHRAGFRFPLAEQVQKADGGQDEQDCVKSSLLLSLGHYLFSSIRLCER